MARAGVSGLGHHARMFKKIGTFKFNLRTLCVGVLASSVLLLLNVRTRGSRSSGATLHNPTTIHGFPFEMIAVSPARTDVTRLIGKRGTIIILFLRFGTFDVDPFRLVLNVGSCSLIIAVACALESKLSSKDGSKI